MSHFDDFMADHIADHDAEYMYMEQEAKQGYWTMKNGETIHISDMTENHIRNCIKYIEKHDREDLYLPWIYEFRAELERRGNKHGQ